MGKKPKLYALQRLDVLQVCAIAANFLKECGFELRYTSMDSEACYYAMPGRPEQIRVAAHGNSPGYPGSPPVVAKLTFVPNSKTGPHPGMIETSLGKIENHTCGAIGRYHLMCARTPLTPRADGG